MIRMIIEITQDNAGDVSTKLMTDGLQTQCKRYELMTAELIRDAINKVAGQKIQSFVMTKDLPPSGGNKQT